MDDAEGQDLSENPFRKAIEPTPDAEGAARSRPFDRAQARISPVRSDKMRTIADLGLVDAKTLERTPAIRDLTVHDLNDLAAEFSGIPTSNRRVSDLTIEDIQSIEAVFTDFKLKAGRDLAAKATKGTGSSVDVSCCCCTPCCCCAATDLSHTG